MSEVGLLVTGLGQSIRRELNPRGTTIGRSEESCDCVLNDLRVSRKHARLFQDPFGRWVVEDLESHNGILVNGQKVQGASLGVGDTITIGPFTLKLSTDVRQQAKLDATIVADSSIVESESDELVRSQQDEPELLSSGWLLELNRLADQLSEVFQAEKVFSEGCHLLATTHNRTASVIRISSLFDAPKVIASSCLPDISDEEGTAPVNIRLSKRVIEAVRTSKQPVMAGNVKLAPQQMDLTLTTEDGRPRVVVCSPISVQDEAMDALYFEVVDGAADKGILDFTRAVARHMALAKKAALAASQSTERRLLDHQLAMARAIQMGLAPKLARMPKEVDVALLYRPALWVGGDYCDVWELPNKKIAFAIGDVSGKGLPAALAMASLHAALKAAAHFTADPSKALSYVSDHVERHFPEGTFATMVFGVLEYETGRLEYVNAGHILPILVNGEEVSEVGHPMNPPIGVEVTKGYAGDSVLLSPGAGLVIVTDGITEASSPTGDDFGVKGLLSTLSSVPAGSSQDRVNAVASAAEKFRESLPQRDDVTILALFLQPQKG